MIDGLRGVRDVFVVTRSDMVLATFGRHDDAVAYVERDDVGGPHGRWAYEQYEYTSPHGIYLIWNQTVWER